MNIDQKMKSVDEVSAFQLDEEMKEDEIQSIVNATKQISVQSEELSKERAQTLATRKELMQKFSPLAIDLTAVKDFFGRVKLAIDDDDVYWESIGIMAELIEHIYKENEEDPATQLMCVRGLLILLINEHLADFSG